MSDTQWYMAFSVTKQEYVHSNTVIIFGKTTLLCRCSSGTFSVHLHNAKCRSEAVTAAHDVTGCSTSLSPETAQSERQ